MLIGQSISEGGNRDDINLTLCGSILTFFGEHLHRSNGIDFYALSSCVLHDVLLTA